MCFKNIWNLTFLCLIILFSLYINTSYAVEDNSDDIPLYGSQRWLPIYEDYGPLGALSKLKDGIVSNKDQIAKLSNQLKVLESHLRNDLGKSTLYLKSILEKSVNKKENHQGNYQKDDNENDRFSLDDEREVLRNLIHDLSKLEKVLYKKLDCSNNNSSNADFEYLSMFSKYKQCFITNQ